MLSTTNAKPCFSWFSETMILSKSEWLILQTDRSIPSTRMRSALVFSRNFCLEAFFQHPQILILADVTAQCLPLNSQYIQQKTSKYACHQGLGRDFSIGLARIVWSRLLFWIILDLSRTLYTLVLPGLNEVLQASL